jgi:hypothetical protein
MHLSNDEHRLFIGCCYQCGWYDVSLVSLNSYKEAPPTRTVLFTFMAFLLDKVRSDFWALSHSPLQHSSRYLYHNKCEPFPHNLRKSLNGVEEFFSVHTFMLIVSRELSFGTG